LFAEEICAKYILTPNLVPGYNTNFKAKDEIFNQFLRVKKWKILRNLFLRMTNIYSFLRIWAK